MWGTCISKIINGYQHWKILWTLFQRTFVHEVHSMPISAVSPVLPVLCWPKHSHTHNSDNCCLWQISWNHFTMIYELIIQIFYKTVCSYMKKNNDLIRSQFCTWHDSKAVVTCAKLWHEWISRIDIIVKEIATAFQLWARTRYTPQKLQITPLPGMQLRLV